ncbi:type II toxin-antitoxin system PemK/MazF family toxin [Microbispora amethystogenes]|uniref:type II toxin-antitoxin system PemK/MazF family toxin n=1 Tax=Microbispora amethystogenes TaxID=1427754 RepID=UPI0033C010FD
MRGDVYRLRAPRGAVGHEQRGERFAIVLQSDGFALSTLVVAPTSTSAGRAVFRPEIEVEGKTTRVLVDQLSAVTPPGSVTSPAASTLTRCMRSTSRCAAVCSIDSPLMVQADAASVTKRAGWQVTGAAANH